MVHDFLDIQLVAGASNHGADAEGRPQEQIPLQETEFFIGLIFERTVFSRSLDPFLK